MEWVDKFEEKINKEWEELQHKPQWSKEVLSKEEVVELLKSIEVEDSKVDESLKSIKGVNGRSFGFNQANKEWRAARDKVIRNLTTKSMEITTLPNLDSKPKTPSIGEKVRKARMDCGLSQLELAKQVGLMSSTAICLMEKDERKINARTLRQIAHTTNKPITFFFEL